MLKNLKIKNFAIIEDINIKDLIAKERETFKNMK